MDSFENQPITDYTESTNSLLTKTFFRMFLGLLATAIAAFYSYSSGLLETILLNGSYTFLLVAEVVVVFVFSLCFRKLSAGIVTALFFAYAFLNGVTLASIFYIFELTSVAYAFLATAALFGILAYVGKNTTKDLTKFGTILSVTLIVGLVLSIVNLFLGFTMLDIILDWAILFIFMGFTIYDMNKLRNMQDLGYYNDEKLYVYGAMELYLDFINIFLRILSIFGKRKN